MRPVTDVRYLAIVALTAAALTSVCANDTPVSPTVASASCLGSGNETAINAALSSSSGIAVLCQGAVFDLRGPIVFTRDGQQLYTAGLPTGSTRATLRIVSPSIATALVLTGRSRVRVSHVIVDGNRPALGRIPNGEALIAMGGDASGQQVEHVRAFEPRGWSCIHLREGDRGACTGATIAHSAFGPAGQADGTWADGISLACLSSLVHHNTITDATDGGIVIFGASGLIVAGNTIRAQTRRLLGGIAMVDTGFDYSGTVVDSNVIDGAGQKILVGLAMGSQAWTCRPGAPMLSGAIVSHNVLLGDMGYGYAVNGVTNWSVTSNVDNARHTGTPVRSCAGVLPSAPGAFQIARNHSSGTFQSDFTDATLDAALFAFGDPAARPFARAPVDKRQLWGPGELLNEFKSSRAR